MSKDLGWFLISVGIVWIVLITPLELGFLKNQLSLPIGLIIIGFFNVVNYFLNSELLSKFNGILFVVFIILVLRAYSWDMPFLFMHEMTPRSNVYETSFIPNSTVLVDCDVCEIILGKSDAYADIKVNYPAGVIVSNLSNGLKIDNSNHIGSSLVNASLPVGMYNLMTDAGSVKGFFEGSGNVTVNVGSIDLDLIINGDLIVSSDVGSINLLIEKVYGSSVVYVSTDVGSIDINLLGESIDYFIEANTSIGSVVNKIGSKSKGYDTAVNKIKLVVSTDVGSISII